ncbi:hypothetical protein MHU86_22706 [Fragilaria crotonensis]|nr:hypothetical protein MHU86_22706 [Fragilaria crotonensis]
MECQLYMAIPKGFEVQDKGQDYVLKLKKNLFGQKQAGRVWNQHLVVNKLKEVESFQVRLMNPQELDDIIQEMKAVELNLTVEGEISDFLGVQIDRINDNTFNPSQPYYLINDIIKEWHLDGENVAIKTSFKRDWDQVNAEWDPDTARSRTGYVILYA